MYRFVPGSMKLAVLAALALIANGGSNSTLSDELMDLPGEGGNANQANEEDSEEDREEQENSKPEETNVETTPEQLPSNLIFVCEGTAKALSYCQFPFSTLAGNHYTSTCADKVEDNPDYSVDRPWCFTSATQWGFCDCEGFLDFTYVSNQLGNDHNTRAFTVQMKLSHPGTVWCALSQTEAAVPALADVTGQKVIGASTDVSIDMIRQEINGQIEFQASLEVVRTHPFLSCQADIRGLPANPKPVVTKLGTKKDMLEDPTDDSDNQLVKPKLVTRTSGALMYSTLIVMILAGFFFYRYAMDRRIKMLSFIRLEQEETALRPLKVVSQ
jgi:hypothetical protein